VKDVLNEILCCPLCKSPVRIHADYYNCSTCGKAYPIICGIPDFRVTDLPPNYRTQEEDTEIAKYLHNHFDSWDYQELVTRCVKLQDEITKTDPELTNKYINYRLNQKGKIEKRTNLIFNLLEDKKIKSAKFPIGIDFGCGSGAGIVSQIPFCRNVLGMDIQLSELIVAKKYLMNENISNFFLLAGSIEKLPFKQRSISFATSFDVFEHIQMQEQHLIEINLILSNKGLYIFDMPNRYFLGYEPHVQIPCVGFVPRPLQDRYVRAVSFNKKRYTGKKLLSFLELKKLLKKYLKLNYALYNSSSVDKNHMIYSTYYDDNGLFRHLQFGLIKTLKRVIRTMFCGAFLVIVSNEPKSDMSKI